MKRVLFMLTALCVVGLFGLASPTRAQNQSETGVLAGLISRALSTPTTRIAIGAVEGALSSDATIRDVTISDRDGVWLKLDRARIVWRRTALLQRRLEIDTLEINTLDVIRNPAPADEPVAGDQEPIIPEVPLRVDVQSFALKTLNLGEPVLGTAARLTAKGNAHLGDPKLGLTLNMVVDRTDATGHAEIALGYVPQTDVVDVKLALNEPEGGIAARLMSLPGLPPVTLTLAGTGPLDRFAATLDFNAGSEIGAQGRVNLMREQNGRRLKLDMNARISAWLPPVISPAFEGTTALQGGAFLNDNGAVALDGLTLRSKAAQLALTGQVSPDRELDLKASLRSNPTARDVTQMGENTVRSVAFDATVTGPALSPTARGNLDIVDLRTPDLRVDRITTKLTFDPDRTTPDRFALLVDGQGSGITLADPAQARAVGKSANLTLRATLGPRARAEISVLRLQTNTLSANVAGSVERRDLSLKGRLEAADLTPFSGLAGRPVSGAAALNVVLTGDPRYGRYDAALDGQLRNPKLGFTGLDRLAGNEVRLKGDVSRTLRELRFGNLTLSGAFLTARVDGRYGEDGNDLTFDATLPDLRRADPTLRGSATVAAKLTGTPVDPVVKASMRVGEGTLTFDGHVGENLDLTLGIQTLPLTFSAMLAPDQGILGTVNGSARITGPRNAPQGPFSLTVSNLTTNATRSAGIGAMSLKAEGEFADAKARFESVLQAGKAGTLRAKGILPLAMDQSIDVALDGSLDASVANGLLAGTGRRVSGRVAVDMKFGGTPKKPVNSGALTLTGGTFDDPIAGVRLTAITARLAARGDTLAIERASATTRNGGTLTANGNVTFSLDDGFPGHIQITGRRADIIKTDTIGATADLDLTIDGPFLRAPRVAGRIGLISADIRVPDRLGKSLQPLPGTAHVAPPPQARARLAEMKPAAASKGRRTPVFDATLNIVLDAPRAIFIRGRGLDLELGGNLRLTGTLREPVPIGEFTLRRGRFQLLAQTLDFVRGRLSLTGDLTPTLDLAAQTQAVGTTIIVQVTGRADEPEFTITSQPELPQDEALSRLLFGTVSAGLSPFQAIQLAQAAAQLSGNSGADPFDSLRRSLGLDALDLVSGSGGPGVGLARTLGSRTRVGLQTGATPAQNSVNIDVDVTRRLRVRGEVDATGGTALGAGAEWEW